MLKDKQTQPATSSNKKKDSREKLEDLSTLKKLKSIDLDTSSGFICDINTGICGPVNQKKEGKE
ncbi:hypothetical protein [Paucisalibacillus globulus]|uniref:hypothetical protein n=1 Tax=Paucisalibacillus globulus TaxID=351095 RepID=UPI00042020CF|nr:hypothetical protein [Paucisalibacillus globulus]